MDLTLAQIINMKQESRKSMWMAKENAYLSGRLWCATLYETDLSAPFDCEVVLMTLLLMLWLTCSLEISIYGSVLTTQQRAEAVQH